MVVGAVLDGAADGQAGVITGTHRRVRFLVPICPVMVKLFQLAVWVRRPLLSVLSATWDSPSFDTH